MERRHGRTAGPGRCLPAHSLLSEIRTLSDLFVPLTQILVKYLALCLAPDFARNTSVWAEHTTSTHPRPLVKNAAAAGTAAVLQIFALPRPQFG